MSDLRELINQQESAIEGDWFDLPVGRVKLATVKSKKFQKAYRREEEVYRKAHRIKPKKELSGEDLVKVFAKAMWKLVVLDWDGLVLDGEHLEFNWENYAFIMGLDGNEGVWAIRDPIMDIVSDDDSWESEAEDEVTKNS